MMLQNMKKEIPVERENLENYKTLRANIEFSGAENKVIGLTSSIPGEGKSTISFRLAYEFAISGKKTIFIDADMRRSMFSERFGIAKENGVGLSELIAKKCELSEVMRRSNVDNLSLILSGRFPPNPAELLGSPEFARTIEGLRESYDYIIIDTPPLSSVIDAAVISQVCDGMVLVIGSDMISCRVVERVKKQLERSGCRILGAVLNKIKISNRTAYGTYGTSLGQYYGYQNYYGE